MKLPLAERDHIMNEIIETKLDLESLKSISLMILDEAKRCGAEHAEVNVAANKGFSVSAREGNVETVEYNQDKSIEITVFMGKKTGSSSISDVRSQAIRDAVEAACHIAKFTDEDPASGLADKADLAFNYPDLEMDFPWHISVEEAIKLACECEREAVGSDKRIMSAEEVTVATEGGDYVYANSLGFVGAFPFSRHEISCVLVAKDGEDMQRDYGYTIACNPAKLKSISYVAKEAVKRTVSRLGARKLKTMKVPVMFIAEEARSLLGHFAGAISGGSIYRRSSFLVDHLDKKIFPDFVHIQELPHLLSGLGSAPFDNDGVRTRNNVFIENGILKSYALGTYSARKLNMKTTGNAGGTHNLTVKTSDNNFEQMLKLMGRGLLVTDLIGSGVNLLTGDYSRGAGGFWVENGEIQYPVHEITIAGNLRDIYQNIVSIGNDVDERGNVRTGSILIEGMMVAGN
jgi:PmbA protein